MIAEKKKKQYNIADDSTNEDDMSFHTAANASEAMRSCASVNSSALSALTGKSLHSLRQINNERKTSREKLEKAHRQLAAFINVSRED